MFLENSQKLNFDKTKNKNTKMKSWLLTALGAT